MFFLLELCIFVGQECLMDQPLSAAFVTATNMMQQKHHCLQGCGGDRVSEWLKSLTCVMLDILQRPIIPGHIFSHSEILNLLLEQQSKILCDVQM